PDNALAMSFGVGLLVQLGQTDRAREWIARTLIVEPDDVVIRFNLACSLTQMGETDEALDLLESSVSRMAAIRDWFRTATDLAPLDGDPRYQALVAGGAAR